jgi:hypothetical protein
LLDLIGAVEDLDNRRALVERVTSSVAKLLPPEPVKSKRQRKPRGGATEEAQPSAASTGKPPAAPESKRRARLPRKGEVLTNILGRDVVLK